MSAKFQFTEDCYQLIWGKTEDNILKNITDEQKIYELSKIWKEAAYNFAFWDKVDIDWDEEYRRNKVITIK